MELKEKSNVCYRCGNFIRYYTKGLYQFSITKYGFCNNKSDIVEGTDYCESWKSGHCRLCTSKKASMKVLSEMLMNITAIRQLLQEVDEEKENE